MFSKTNIRYDADTNIFSYKTMGVQTKINIYAKTKTDANGGTGNVSLGGGYNSGYNKPNTESLTELHLKTLDTDNLYAKNAEIGKLSVNEMQIKDLRIKNAEIETLNGRDINGEHIKADKLDVKDANLDNLRIGDYNKGISGAIIDKDGNAELKSLKLRESLEVPELRYQKQTAVNGIIWHTAGGGVIDHVSPNNNGTGSFTLKLDNEYGQAPAVQIGDKCMGVWHRLQGLSNERMNRIYEWKLVDKDNEKTNIDIVKIENVVSYKVMVNGNISLYNSAGEAITAFNDANKNKQKISFIVNFSWKITTYVDDEDNSVLNGTVSTTNSDIVICDYEAGGNDLKDVTYKFITVPNGSAPDAKDSRWSDELYTLSDCSTYVKVHADYDFAWDKNDYDGHNGNFMFKDFKTVYFQITGVNGDTVNYKLRYKEGNSEGNIYDFHPQDGMSFVEYANATMPERQFVSYETPKYQVRLKNMKDWTYDDSNIVSIDGDLTGFHIGDKEFKETGSVLQNAYIYGHIEKFENNARRMNLELEKDNANILYVGQSTVIIAKLKEGAKLVDMTNAPTVTIDGHKISPAMTKVTDNGKNYYKITVLYNDLLAGGKNEINISSGGESDIIVLTKLLDSDVETPTRPNLLSESDIYVIRTCNNDMTVTHDEYFTDGNEYRFTGRKYMELDLSDYVASDNIGQHTFIVSFNMMNKNLNALNGRHFYIVFDDGKTQKKIKFDKFSITENWLKYKSAITGLSNKKYTVYVELYDVMANEQNDESYISFKNIKIEDAGISPSDTEPTSYVPSNKDLLRQIGNNVMLGTLKEYNFPMKSSSPMSPSGVPSKIETPIKIEANTDYVISFEVKYTGSVNNTRFNVGNLYTNLYFPTKEWQRISVCTGGRNIFSSPEDTEVNLGFYTGVQGMATLSVRHIKIEKGHVDTEWQVSEFDKVGIDGKQGKTPRQRGKHDANIVYGDDDRFLDIVYTKDGENYHWYKCKKKTSAGIGVDNTEYWEQADEFKFIATDILLSKDILATEGKFDGLHAKNAEIEGTIKADKGYFRGIIQNGITEINADTYKTYTTQDPDFSDGIWFDFSKMSNIVKFTGDLSGVPSSIIILFPSSNFTGRLDEARGYLGKEVYIYNFSNVDFALDGDIRTTESSSASSPQVSQNRMFKLVCKLGDRNGTEEIYWLIEKELTPLNGK